MQIDKEGLRQRFDRLWLRTGANTMPSLVDELFNKMWTAYHETHRRYHNMRHVVECIDLLDNDTATALGLGDEQRDAVLLALWFHDVVYYTQAPKPGVSNEELSAAWARGVLQAAQAREYFPRVILRLIASTAQGHEPQDLLEEVVHDIDYAILGADWERFNEYDASIAVEWATMPTMVYLEHRATFLRRALQQPRLYRTDLFHERFDAARIANLERVLDQPIYQRNDAAEGAKEHVR